MTNKEIIFKRPHEAGVDSEPLGPMDFEPQTFADPLAQFEESLKAAGGQSVRLNSGDDINEVIRGLYPDAKNIASDLTEITCANINPDTVDEPQKLAGTDVAVVCGDFGVAENGMVWVPRNVRWKALYFVAEALVLLLDHKKVVSNMHQAMQRPELNDFDFGCFIAGPSKTADIEQALVIGAHGARNLTVLLY